jgi:hypothetical protein
LIGIYASNLILLFIHLDFDSELYNATMMMMIVEVV